MLNPIDKPNADTIRRAKYVGCSAKDGQMMIRYAVPSTQRKPVPVGACVIPDFVFEVHVSADGGPATWWQVLDRNPALDLR